MMGAAWKGAQGVGWPAEGGRKKRFPVSLTMLVPLEAEVDSSGRTLEAMVREALGTGLAGTKSQRHLRRRWEDV